MTTTPIRHFSITTILALLAASTCWGEKAPKPAEAPRPNILLILTDDIGWGDMHYYNPKSKIPTPNVDRLAREGMMFTHAHTPAALCAPTRYSMLTGNYSWRGRNFAGTWGFNVPSHLLPGQQTGASLLQASGYRTAMFGKAGIGGFFADTADPKSKHQLAPLEWGFDYSYLIPRGHQSEPHAFYENGVRVNQAWDASQIGERLLTKASTFLDDCVARNKASGKAQPFYMHFCTDGAHGPYVPAAQLAGEVLKGATKMTDHTDMVYQTDILTGKLMEALTQRGLLDNTLIVYTSDNGGLPYERSFGHDAVAGLRGAKSYVFEGGTRVPFVVRWPGKIPAGTVRHQTLGTLDFVATGLELAGVRVPESQAMDSVSLVPVLLGKRDDSQPIRSNLLVQSTRNAGDDGGFRAGKSNEAGEDSEAAPKAAPKGKGKKEKGKAQSMALYEGNWKLVFNTAEKPVALYDLAKDLAEEKNLLSDPSQATRLQSMKKLYREIRHSKRRLQP